MKKYKIENSGCDDVTIDFFELTDEQYEFLKSIFEKLNQKSEYVCMPTIYIEPYIEPEDEEEDENSRRNFIAVSIKHSEYRWEFGKPLVLWGHRTSDDELRSFGGYTQYPNNAEVYSMEDWENSGYKNGDVMKLDEPVHMELNFCKKWRKYDTVLVPMKEIIEYYKMTCLALDKPKED